jgi:hypothetical protein
MAEQVNAVSAVHAKAAHDNFQGNGITALMRISPFW